VNDHRPERNSDVILFLDTFRAYGDSVDRALRAAIGLADLYLKGDGVAKSCDQARVLLDSAARRGMSGAGARLRNLQAFGCQ